MKLLFDQNLSFKLCSRLSDVFPASAQISPDEITGLSEKQLGRIEKGECRLTSNAIEALSKAHKLKPNEYLKKLAEALG